jgi:deoxyribose-phosphate aldolase
MKNPVSYWMFRFAQHDSITLFKKSPTKDYYIVISMNEKLTLTSLSKMIDHSLLHPTMTDAEILRGCEIAKKYDVATVCIKPYAIEMCKKYLEGTNVGICSVVTFPHGNSTTKMKVKETEEALELGATEIDMVVNIGKVIGGEWQYVSDEIQQINIAVISKNAILKVIFENDYLTNEQIAKLCEICSSHSVAFVKTSSGYGFVKQPNGMYSYKGATDEHLKLMREKSAMGIQIKAAGGVRTLDDLLRVRSLGVTRIGATATSEILEVAKARGIV